MLDVPVAIALIVSAVAALVSAAGGYYAAASREDRPTAE